MILLLVTLLVLAGLMFWWLSGFDSKVTGENKNADLFRRILRCVATAVLLWIFFAPNPIKAGYGFIPLLMIIPVSLGLLWCNPLGDLLSRGLHRMIDSDDRREFDPNQGARDLDMVASLLKSGRHEEAAQLCEALKHSGDANILVLETMLARSGIQFESGRKTRPLTEAHRLHAEGKFDETEMVLKSLLAENPANVDAALMLMRLYVQDFQRSDKAAEVLRALEKQPHIPTGLIEYAQRSIHDWGREERAPEAVVLPESVDELLACGYQGTAIEILERKVREQPHDFDSWLKLAEAHGLYSGNLHRAEKIIDKIEGDRDFSAEQIQVAKMKLNEWREAKPRNN